jgi:hypothetical protein
MNPIVKGLKVNLILLKYTLTNWLLSSLNMDQLLFFSSTEVYISAEREEDFF